MADWQDLAAAELGRLEHPHAAKKRTTVIALVDCRLAGTSEETVFQRRDTCSRNTYHAKWKKDPVFADVLETVTGLAREWHGGRAMRAMAQASERLALASPGAVAKIVAVLANSEDDQAVLRAAFGILDRAGLETAEKSTTEVTGVTLEEWRAQQADRQSQTAAALEDFADIDGD
jgi:hypothetical protein